MVFKIFWFRFGIYIILKCLSNLAETVLFFASAELQVVKNTIFSTLIKSRFFNS
jgi:hypothetical protein